MCSLLEFPAGFTVPFQEAVPSSACDIHLLLSHLLL